MLGVPGMLRGSTKLVGLAHCELLKGRVAVSHSYVARSRTGPRVHWANCWETNIPGDFVVPDILLPSSPRPAPTPPRGRFLQAPLSFPQPNPLARSCQEPKQPPPDP